MKPQDGKRRFGNSQPAVGGKICLLREAQIEQVRQVTLNCLLPDLTDNQILALKAVLERFPGDLPVYMQLELPDNLRVAACDEFKVAVERCVGYNAAVFE